MERHETADLSAVLREHERAAKEKLKTGYDPVVMIRVVEWSGICWAYDQLSESEGASDPRHELMGWMLVQDALRDDESVRWRVHQDALGLIMDSFGVQDWRRSDRTAPYDWPNKDVLAERYAACRNECADDDERYMWQSVERALRALSDHGARTLSLAGDLGLPADLTRIFAAWLHVETLQYRPGTFTYDVMDKAYGEACRC